jgi:hypothetical protein
MHVIDILCHSFCAILIYFAICIVSIATVGTGSEEPCDISKQIPLPGLYFSHGVASKPATSTVAYAANNIATTTDTAQMKPRPAGGNEGWVIVLANWQYRRQAAPRCRRGRACLP